MFLFNRFKKEITRRRGSQSRKLKKTLDSLLLQIELIKGDFNLDEIFQVIGEALLKIQINSVISIIDDKRENVVIRHISLEDDQLNLPKIKKLQISKLDKYLLAIDKQQAIFCRNRVNQLKKKIPDIKPFLNRIDEINSIIVPLILRGEVIGILEIFSQELKESEVNIVKNFSQELVIRIANTILFHEIKESEQRYRDLFKNAKEGFLILNGRLKKLIEVNKGLCKISGYTRAELLQMNYLMLFDHSERKRIGGYIKNRLEGIFDSKEAPMSYEAKIKTKKGEHRFVRITITRIISEGEWFCIIEDITERKQVEQALQKSEEKYRKLVDNAEDGVFILNARGYITFGNQVLYKIFNYNEKELAKTHFSKLIHPDDYNLIAKRFNDKVKGKKVPPNYEFRIIDKAGEIKFVSYSGSSITEGGKVVGVQGIIRDVTENKKLQEKIEQAKNHYEQVIDTIQDGICVINKDFKIVSCNKIFLEEINLQLNEVKGRNCKDVILCYKNNLFRNYSANICKKKCVAKEVFKSGKAFSIVEKNIDMSGKIYYHKVSAFPTKNKEGGIYQVVVTIRDITERKIAEEEIRRLSEFNKRILDNVPVSIVVLNKEGIIISVNELAKKLMGKSEKQVVGRKLVNTKYINRDEELSNLYKLLLGKGEPFYYNNMPYSPYGSNKELYLNIIAVPLLNKDRKVDGAISMALDNTEAVLAKRKLEDLNRDLERKVAQRTQELDKVNRELSKVLELKSKFIADASHELRTPLTVIQGNLDLAVREINNMNREVPETFILINKEIEQMTSILTDLTMLTNTDSQSERIAYEKVDLESLIKAVSQSLKILADQKKIKINYKKAKGNLSVMGDETKLEKLLLNIVRNAIKYNEDNGWIKIWTERGEKEAKIFVEDNGIGIPEQDLPYIFERFYRVDKARSKSEGGTGLGLAICKWIAEAHNGKINVESKLGQGSKFIIYLPYR